MEAFDFYFPLIIIVSTSLYFLTRKLLNRYRNLPPSPFPTLPVIGHLHLFKRPIHRSLAALSARYGPILSLRFGCRPVVLVSSPDFAEECFTKNDVVFANRPRLLAGKHLGHDYTTLTWAPYGDHWRNLRRIASTEILSSNRMQASHQIRADEVRLLIRCLFRASKEGGEGELRKLEMKSVFFELMLNVVMRMIAGKRYYGENVAEAEEARKFKEIVSDTFRFSGANNLVDFIPAVKWMGLDGGIEKNLVGLQGKRDGFMKNLIEEHRKRIEDDRPSSVRRSRTMIDVLLSLQETEPEYYTDQIISGLMQVILGAGTDTSAGTMEWALSLLLNNPDALLKSQAEIDDRVGHARLINESDLNSLPYLQGVIMETLRMYPAASLIPPHESSDQCSIGGFTIPRGTMLLVNLWAIQNDPRAWPDPEVFRPERFATGPVRPEGYPTGDGFRLMPFGAGRRRCPGEGLAMRMVGLGLGSLIQCFEWRRDGEEMVDMTEGTGLTTPKAEPLVAQYRPRPTMLNVLSQL